MKHMTRKSSEHIDSYDKFRKAIRYEIPLADIDHDKVWKSGGMRITPQDLLKGIKTIKALGSTKYKDAYAKYIKNLKKIYIENRLWIYTENGESELKYNQYPAPSGDYYVNYIVFDKRYNIDEAIKILETFIKNEKKPFVKKEIPDIGLHYMFYQYDEIIEQPSEHATSTIATYQYEFSDQEDVKLQRKIADLIDRAYKLGIKGAAYEKATSRLYFKYSKLGFDPKEVVKITEELIIKHKDYSALCEYGYANEYINNKKLMKYYVKAIELGFCVDEKYAKIAELVDGKKAAMKIRMDAYKRYKKLYQKQKTDKYAEYYGYSAYNLGLALLKELFYERWFSKPHKNQIKAKDLRNQRWKEYIKEAKWVLNGNNCDDLAVKYITTEDPLFDELGPNPDYKKRHYVFDTYISLVQSDIKDILNDKLVDWMDNRFGLFTN